MPTEKSFDPTLPRVSADVPDDIHINDDVMPSSAASSMFADTLDPDRPMPPPLAGEMDSPSPPYADAQESSEQMMQGVREKLSLVDGRVRDFVERRPIAALFGAVAAGFLIGRIVSRI